MRPWLHCSCVIGQSVEFPRKLLMKPWKQASATLCIMFLPRACMNKTTFSLSQSTSFHRNQIKRNKHSFSVKIFVFQPQMKLFLSKYFLVRACAVPATAEVAVGAQEAEEGPGPGGGCCIAVYSALDFH